MILNEAPIEMNTFILFQQGNEKAFRQIFVLYQPLIFSRAVHFCGNMVEAEEITQEAFIQLYLYREKIINVLSIYPFLYRVAKRIAVSSFRKKIMRSKYELHQHYSWEEESLADINTLNYRELHHYHEKIIKELPVQQQLIYRLNKLDDRSYQDIADQVGLSKNTVRNHLALATKFVRVRLDKLFLLFL